MNYALRDILAGEEIFGQYLLYVHSTIEETDWLDYISDLKSQCFGKSVGIVYAVASNLAVAEVIF